MNTGAEDNKDNEFVLNYYEYILRTFYNAYKASWNVVAKYFNPAVKKLVNDEEAEDSKDNEWLQWIEDGISRNYINYYEYNTFQNIQHIGSGAFGNVYKANWKISNSVVALKSFKNNNSIMKEIVNEVSIYV
jgi:serine/threonine protein kinase